MKTLCLLLAMVSCALAQQSAASDAGASSQKRSMCESATPVEGASDLAASFKENQVYLLLTIKNSAEGLCFYSDSGGGLMISEDAAKRMGATPSPASDPEMAKALAQELGPDVEIMQASAFNGATHAPGIPKSSFLAVVSNFQMLPGMPETDGLLGQAWLAGHVWTWDYPARKLTLHAEGWHPTSGAKPWPIRFKTDDAGARVTNFARVEIEVDGRKLPMLFDTGAETSLTENALGKLDHTGAAIRATSMITKSVFDGWHQQHPDWPVIEDAQAGTHARMIEVPEVVIAGVAVGSVWFTERPDINFHQYMSSMMDSQVEGAIGGNALRSLKVTIDYPAAKAWIEKD